MKMMKKILSIMLSMMLAFTVGITIAEAAAPVEISTAEEFISTFSGKSSVSGEYWITADIDLTDRSFAMLNWLKGGKILGRNSDGTPAQRTIKTSTTLINQVSNNAVIENLTVQGTISISNVNRGAALVLMVGNATIKSCINEATITSNGTVGGLIGHLIAESAGTNATITDCVNKGNITSTGPYVGGLIGKATTSNDLNADTVKSIFTNCRNEGTVKGTSNVGGMCGLLGANSKITDFINTGNVETTSSNSAGGVAGIISASAKEISIENSSNSGTIKANGDAGGITGILGTNVSILKSGNTGNVTSTGNRAGGIAGSVNTSATAITVTDCYNHGDVTANSHSGGIIGEMKNANVAISNCYNAGKITGINNYVGGIVSWFKGTALTNCYNTGEIVSASTSTRGGLIAYLDNASVTLTNCYDLFSNNVNKVFPFYAARGNSSYVPTANNCYYQKGVGKDFAHEIGTALSAKQTMDLTAFVGFDNAVWTIADSGYPHPQLISNPHTADYTLLVPKLNAPVIDMAGKTSDERFLVYFSDDNRASDVAEYSIIVRNDDGNICATYGECSGMATDITDLLPNLDSTYKVTIKAIGVSNFVDSDESSPITLNTNEEPSIFKVTVSFGEGGTVTPSGNIYVKSGELFNGTITVNDGYQIDKILLNNAEQTVQNEISYTITEDSDLSVIFKKIITEVPRIEHTYTKVFNSNATQIINGAEIAGPMSIVFAKVRDFDGYTLTEYGMELAVNEAALTTGEGQKYPAVTEKSVLGNYGICFYGNFEQGKVYYIRPYAIYASDGKDPLIVTGKTVLEIVPNPSAAL